MNHKLILLKREDILKAGLRQYHVDAQVPVRSANLSNFEPDLYIEGWPLENTRRRQVECPVSVMRNKSELLIGDQNSSWDR